MKGAWYSRLTQAPTWVTAAGLFLLAVALRLIYISSVSESPLVRYPIADSLAYHSRALEILAGDWLGERVFFQDPLYPYFLAGLYAVFGPGSIGVLFAQAFIDAGTVVIVFFLARRVLGDRCALIAGLLASFYKLFWFYDALLLKTSMTVFLITLALLLLLRADASRLQRAWLAAGLLLGVACLTRGNYLAFVPIAFLWLVCARGEPWSRRTLCAASLAIGLALAILPVTVRNWWVGDDLVLITSQAGHNFYVAHFRENDSGAARMPDFSRFNPRFQEGDFRREAERRTGHPMKPSELSRYWIGQGVAEIAADPVHFWHHSIRKVRLFFNDHEIVNNQSYEFFREEVAPLLRLPLPTYGALIPLALWGMLAARRNRAALLLSLYFWSYLPMVVLFYNVSRYRMPVVPVVIVFAAAGIADISRRLAARDVRRVAPAALFLTLAYPVVHQDLVTESFAVQHFNIAVSHLKSARAAERAAQDQPESARAERERAEHLRDLAETSLLRGLEIDPKHTELRRQFRRFGLERAEELERDGRHERALALLQDLVRHHPRLAEGHARAGALYRRLGRSGEARRELERAISLDPAHALAREQ